MKNVADIISAGATRSPEALGVKSGDLSLSYRALDVLVWRAATFLAREGVARGDVVALSFRRELLNLILTLAIGRMGASVLALPLASPRLLRVATAKQCGVVRLVTDLDDVDDAGVSVLRVGLEQFSADSAPIDPAVRDPDPAAPWLVIIGSGSTGRPKRIDLTHRVSLERTRKYVTAFELVSTDRAMCAALFDFAVTKQRFIEVFAAGGAMVFFDRRKDLAKACRDEGINVLKANVVHLEYLLNLIGPEARDALNGLRMLRIGASTVSPQLRERIAKHLSPNIYIAYSTNEFGMISVARPREVIERPDSVGKVVEGVRLDVVDPKGRVLPAGTVGMIRVRGPGAVSGYVGDEVATRRAFRDGWFYTGDLALRTADGSLLFRGRADRMMILDGMNIYPAEIEQTLLAHPSVAQTVALPLRSSVHQDVPVCVVELRDGSSATEEELFRYARERLGVRSPRRVVILDRIPRTEQGKVRIEDLKRALGEIMDVPVLREGARERDA